MEKQCSNAVRGGSKVPKYNQKKDIPSAIRESILSRLLVAVKFRLMTESG